MPQNHEPTVPTSSDWIWSELVVSSQGLWKQKGSNDKHNISYISTSITSWSYSILLTFILFLFWGWGGERRWGMHTPYPCAFLVKRKTQQQHNSIHHCINIYCMRTDTHISYLLSEVFGQSCRLFSQLLGEGCTWCLFRLRFLFLFPRCTCTCTCSHLAGSFCIAIVCFCSIKAAAGGFVQRVVHVLFLELVLQFYWVPRSKSIPRKQAMLHKFCASWAIVWVQP